MRNRKVMMSLILAAVLSAPATLVLAQDKELDSAVSQAFRAADFDRDGKVSWEEFRNRVVMVFGHLDHDEDGRLVGEEHPHAVDDKGTPVQPGNVTAESFAASIGEAFKAADKDGDGALSLEEWSGQRP